MNSEPLFGDEVPVKHTRKGVHKTTSARLDALLADMPRSAYVATDDDLPLIFWPEPTFEEEQ